MSERNFVDYVKIFCASGKGGAGSAHFLRTRINARGGPDGGDGGRGGHIILKGNKQLWTLLHLKYTETYQGRPRSEWVQEPSNRGLWERCHHRSSS